MTLPSPAEEASQIASAEATAARLTPAIDRTLVSPFEAKTGGWRHRLPEKKSLLGHSTASISQKRPANQ